MVSHSGGVKDRSNRLRLESWRRRFGFWILSFDLGLKHYWKWLAEIGLDPACHRRIVLSMNSKDCTEPFYPVTIHTPSLPLDTPYTTMDWHWTWYHSTTRGLEKCGDPGEDTGHLTIVCIMQSSSLGGPGNGG